MRIYPLLCTQGRHGIHVDCNRRGIVFVVVSLRTIVLREALGWRLASRLVGWPSWVLSSWIHLVLEILPSIGRRLVFHRIVWRLVLSWKYCWSWLDYVLVIIAPSLFHKMTSSAPPSVEVKLREEPSVNEISTPLSSGITVATFKSTMLFCRAWITLDRYMVVI